MLLVKYELDKERKKNVDQKRLVLISGIVGPMKSSNQSFMNTVKGYLDNGFKVYHFAFYSKKNQKYELSALLKYENYKFFGIPNFLSYFVNGRKRKKNHKKNHNFWQLPNPNEIIKPHSELTKSQFIFKLFYDIFESLRQVIITPFLKPDIIYAYEIYAVMPGYLISKSLNKPFVKRFQGTFIDKDNIDSKTTLFHKKAYEKDCTLNIMANDGTKGDVVLKKLGFKDDKILFLLNGLDERITKPAEKIKIQELNGKLKLEDKDLVLGIFNRFYPFKRIDRAVQLLKELKKEINDPQLLIGGMSGPMEIPIKKFVKDNKLENYVTFLGQVKYDDMLTYYNICDVILILNDYANTGNQLLEAAYLGKQTIATDDGSNSKVLKYDNIHYVKPHNFLEESLKAALEIYKNKDRVKEKINEDILTWEERMKIEINKIDEIIAKWDK